MLRNTNFRHPTEILLIFKMEHRGKKKLKMDDESEDEESEKQEEQKTNKKKNVRKNVNKKITMTSENYFPPIKNQRNGDVSIFHSAVIPESV
jgi:hypothetical protein